MKTIYTLLFMTFVGVQTGMAQQVHYRTMPRETLEKLEALRASEYDATQERMGNIKNRMDAALKAYKDLKKQYKEQKKLSSQQKKDLKDARKALKLRDKLRKISQ